MPKLGTKPARRGSRVIEQFSRYQRSRGFSANTIERRRSTLRVFSAYLAPKPLTDATTVDVEEWLATRRSPRTRHANRSDLRVFYRWAYRRDLIDHDPAEAVDPVKVPKSLPRPIGPGLEAAFLVGRRRTRRMVALGLFAGLRCGEIAVLDAADVALHLDPPLLTVRNGKGGKDRVIPIHPLLADLLADAPRFGPLFPNELGDPINADSVSRTISNHLAKIGVNATPHQLRHTFGTEFARLSDGNLVALAKLMGHESTNTTMGYVGWAGESAGIVSRMFGRAMSLGASRRGG